MDSSFAQSPTVGRVTPEERGVEQKMSDVLLGLFYKRYKLLLSSVSPLLLYVCGNLQISETFTLSTEL